MKYKSKNITPIMVISRVCYYYDISIDEIYSNAGTKRISVPRKVALYLLAKIADIDYKGMAELFNKKKSMHGAAKWMKEEQLHNSQNARIAKKIEDELMGNDE